jgi:hypothetical protein
MNCRKICEAIDAAQPSAHYPVEVRAHIDACGACRRHVEQTSRLLALMAAAPRVTAPEDFELRLRVRLNEARENRGGLAAILAPLRALTFSWSEAATALAAVAIVAAFAALFVLRQGRNEAVGELVSATSPEPAALTTPAPVAVRERTADRALTPSPERRLARAAAREAAPLGRSSRGDLIATGASAMTRQARTAGTQEILIYRPGASRAVRVPRQGQVAWGAQLVTAAAPRAVSPVIETF